MKRRKLIWLGMLGLSLWAGTLHGAQPIDKTEQTPQADLVATLEVAPDAPPKTVQLRLRLENRGTARIFLVRLRSGWLEYNGGSFHNWSIQIDGPGGRYHFPLYENESLAPMMREAGLIDLAPGESFATRITLDEAAVRQTNGANQTVRDTPGLYTVAVSGGVPDFPLDIKGNVLLQTLQSNTLKFDTRKE